MTARKTIYLDFDGVLHPNVLQKGQAFCHVPLLESALAGKSVGIIISSSWRLHETWEYIEMLFPSSIRGFLNGCTGKAYSGRWSRWNEINEHASKCGVGDWVALDDYERGFPPECPNLIICDGSIGLQQPQITELDEWLERS